MIALQSCDAGASRKTIRVFPALVCIVGCILVARAVGQAPNPPAPTSVKTIGGFQPQLPVLRERPPRPATDGLFDELSANDAAFEVVLGQGRVLTLGKEIAVAGKPNPSIIVGDPSIVDFEVLPDSRLIRVYGIRPGPPI
jgi:hypothetical protein